jgi:hypothetical protein
MVTGAFKLTLQSLTTLNFLRNNIFGDIGVKSLDIDYYYYYGDPTITQTISNNNFHDNQADVTVKINSNFIFFVNNNFTSNNASTIFQVGNDLHDSNINIQQNKFYNNLFSASLIEFYGYASSNTIITSNAFHNNSLGYLVSLTCKYVSNALVLKIAFFCSFQGRFDQ